MTWILDFFSSICFLYILRLGNFSCSVICSLIFVFLSSSYSTIGIFLVLGMMSNFFLLILGYFGYYIVRLWILFKLSVLSTFLWCHSSRGRVGAASLLLNVSKILIYFLASIDMWGNDSSLLWGICGNARSPTGLHWHIPIWEGVEHLVTAVYVASSESMCGWP